MSTAAPEPSIFTRIIAGEIPGRFVWADDVCVAFATIEPQTPRHVLVVPREQVTTLVDADEATVAHLAVVARRIAATQLRVFGALRPGILVVGLDVAHLHVHVLPINEVADINPACARPAAGTELDEAMETLRAGLREDGWGRFVPAVLGSAALA